MTKGIFLIYITYNTMLKTLWNKATAAIEEAKKERKLKGLHLQAEIDLAEIVRAVNEKEDELEAIILKQRDAEKPSFKAIMEKNEELAIARKSKELAIESFEEFFGEKPRFS